ncbi:MAG: AbrB/MazE/SpoVT family DNA-binding domain-containing protein [Planctomycetes bacterium]|nr:AbrB/MazE/SpoVT family DNA-binding domain-containing protein [Planctomycetota bacterium]
MNTQVGKWGNSLAVRIPGPYAKDLDLKEGMDLEVSLVEGGLLLRPRRTSYTLEELLARITPENLHGETDWGPPVGRESW